MKLPATGLRQRVLYLFSAVILTLAMCGTAPPDESPSNKSSIGTTSGASSHSSADCDLELEAGTIDFGTAFEDSRLRHQFQLTNTGTAAIRIVDVSTSCGCTTVDTDIPFTIPAGQTRHVTLQLSTANATGPLEKRVTLFATQNGHGYQYPVTLKAVSVPLVSVSDRALDLGMVRNGQISSKMISVSLHHEHAHSWAAVRAISIPQGVDVLIEEQPPETGAVRRWQISVSISGEDIPPESIDGDLVLQTPSTVEEYIRIPVSARQHSFLGTHSPRVHFGAIRPGHAQHHAVELNCVNGHTFTIESIDVDGPSFLTAAQHRGDTIQVQVGAAATSGFFRGTAHVRYRCDRGREQLLTIPITGYCLPGSPSAD